MTRMRLIDIAILAVFFMLSGCFNNQNARMESSHPNASGAYSNARLGLAYLHHGYTDKAQEKIMLALQQDSDNPTILDAAAFYYEKTGDLTMANQYYMKALLADSKSGAAMNYYGAFLCRNGRYFESLIYLHRAAHTPSYPNAKVAAANEQFCKQEMQRALGEEATWAYYMQQ